jgi:hypothetical protein
MGCVGPLNGSNLDFAEQIEARLAATGVVADVPHLGHLTLILHAGGGPAARSARGPSRCAAGADPSTNLPVAHKVGPLSGARRGAQARSLVHPSALTGQTDVHTRREPLIR